MSFGTVWWSKEPEKIWAVVDTLIEKGVPFVSFPFFFLILLIIIYRNTLFPNLI